MAKRVHRKRGTGGRFVKARSNPARHRRRHHHKNPPSSHRRRRRRNPAAVTMRSNSHHRRRHHRRNPPAARGIIAAAGKGLARGVAVAGGQLLARKARGGLQGVVTTKANVSSGLPGLATTAGAALAGTIAHVMFTPARHRALGDFVVAGMWAEAVNFGLALTPAAPYLSAFPNRSSLKIIDNSPAGSRRLGAYNRGGARLGAYSRGGPTFGAYTRTVGVPVSAGAAGNVGY